MHNQTQSYVSHGWVLLTGPSNCRGMGFQFLYWCSGSHPESLAAHPNTPLEKPCPLADKPQPGDTQMLFRTHVFFPEQLPNKPKLLDIFLLTHLNTSPNPRHCSSLLAEKQPYFKVENFWPKTPCIPGGKYFAEMMQSERLECWHGHLLQNTVKGKPQTPCSRKRLFYSGTKPEGRGKRTISPQCSGRRR